ncbi:hypothetical protein BJX70DRAFT_410397 [Aspergillus crustosus]
MSSPAPTPRQKTPRKPSTPKASSAPAAAPAPAPKASSTPKPKPKAPSIPKTPSAPTEPPVPSSAAPNPQSIKKKPRKLKEKTQPPASAADADSKLPGNAPSTSEAGDAPSSVKDQAKAAAPEHKEAAKKMKDQIQERGSEAVDKAKPEPETGDAGKAADAAENAKPNPETQDLKKGLDKAAQDAKEADKGVDVDQNQAQAQDVLGEKAQDVQDKDVGEDVGENQVVNKDENKGGDEGDDKEEGQDTSDLKKTVQDAGADAGEDKIENEGESEEEESQNEDEQGDEEGEDEGESEGDKEEKVTGALDETAQGADVCVGEEEGEGEEGEEEGGHEEDEAEFESAAESDAEALAPEVSPPDLSILEGLDVGENGEIQDDNGTVVGKVVEGDPEDLVGHTVGSHGEILDEDGDLVGRVEAEEEQAEEPEIPDISTLEGLKCNKLGSIVTADGTVVGELIEGNAKKIARGGFQLDKEGQFWDNQGHVIGKAQPVPVEEDESGPFSDMGDIFVAEEGWVQDESGRRVGKLVEGDAKKLVGRPVDDDGEILDKRGNVIGRAEPYEEPEKEEETEEEQEDLSMLEGKTVNKLGNILDDNGALIGRITDGNLKKLAGKTVDGKGQIWSDNGKVIGQAELIPQEEREKPEGAFYGFEGVIVGKDGTVVDASGEIIGRLVEGDANRLKGRAVDEDGDVIDKLGNVIGRAERWEPEPEVEPELSPEEQEKQRKEKEQEELAKKMSVIIQKTLDSVGPLCRQITNHIEKANQTPKEELDEEKLVKDVKPLIESAGNELQECKGALRALDPDGSIAENAKVRSSSGEATPAEHKLAEQLKELTQTVVETIENGRRLIADMPHAKKKLNPLWALLSEPLFQIIAAVGLLLSGVLGLLSKLLDGLGLGGILRGLLGGLGLDKVLEGFGLGTVTEALGFKGKK